MTTTLEEAPGTPVAIGGTRGGPDKPTLRKDRWWIEPAVTFTILTAFAVYATFAAFMNRDYYAGAALHRNLIAPLDSPCLTGSCVPGSHPFGVWIAAWHITPALLILIFPLGFRLTCYYYRKAYYRSFWFSPPACGVADAHGSYSGETRIPLILQNVHRYFFWLLLIFNAILTYDAVEAFRQPGYGIGISVGTVVLCLNASFLWLYSLSLPCLPPLLRRPGPLVRQAPDPPQAVEAGDAAERAPHEVRLDQPLRRRPVRPLRSTGGQRDHH